MGSKIYKCVDAPQTPEVGDHDYVQYTSFRGCNYIARACDVDDIMYIETLHNMSSDDLTAVFKKYYTVKDTPEFRLWVVEKFGSRFWKPTTRISDHLMSLDNVVKQEWVPKSMRTEEMCIIALKQNWEEAIRWVPYTVLQSDSFYSALIASDFSIPCHENIPAVFYENYVKAIWAEYDEPRAMREIIKRCLNKV
jgi:hypothetical protein